MIILDTNVLSALMPPRPTSLVLVWLDQQPADSIWITTITCFEVAFGIARLPAGKRRVELQAVFDDLVAVYLADRVLDFDRPAALAAAQLAASRQLAGQTVDVRDTQIAGIALSRHATLATRNIRHFAGSGLKIVDPWK